MDKNNSQSGFIVPLVIAVVAVLIIAGGVYYTYEKGKSAGVNQVNTSQSTQPAPIITSINPSSGPIGTIIELKGNNLAGFEGELDAWIENSNGEKAFLPGIGSVPRDDQTIRVKIDSQLCKENLSYKGGPCSSYMTITPGTYRIYIYPWGNMSNTVQFTVTTSASQINSSQPSITVISPNGGAVWKMGQTYTISYTVNGDWGPMTIKLNRYSDDHTLIQSIDIGTSDTNSFMYKVPTSLEDTKGAAGMYKIEIYPATGRELVKRSDYFSIIR